MWLLGDIADGLDQGLRALETQVRQEQAVTGIDALEEIALHPVLAEGLAAVGFGVYLEQRYPSARRRPKETEGERCDLVLTEDGRAPLRATERRTTLFDPPDAVDPDDAFWLEVKVVSQFTEEGPNRTYASQLLSTVGQDVTKLSKEGGILHAGLALVMFVREPAVADHDLGVWQDRCIERGLPIGAPARRVVPVTDRIGHQTCVVSLYPVYGL